MINMEYKYLKELKERWMENPYFDTRENKGCTVTEILALKELIAPYMKRMPKAIEEDLLYFGKYRFNQLGIYLLNKLEAIRDDEIDINAELKIGFWVFTSSHFGILCDNTDYLLQYLKGEKNYKLEDYDNPPFCHKTGDEEDNDIEVTVIRIRYSDTYNYMSNEFLLKYKEFYGLNPLLYQFKQCLVELYSEIEIVAEEMPKPLREKYEYIAHRIRLETGGIVIYREGVMKEILYQFHRANKKSGDQETLTELRRHSDKIDLLYNQLIENWELVKQV